MNRDISDDLIAPCGMDCSLCIAYQFRKNDLNKHGFHGKYCAGCIPRGENCTHMADKCSLLGERIYCHNGLCMNCEIEK